MTQVSCINGISAFDMEVFDLLTDTMKAIQTKRSSLLAACKLLSVGDDGLARMAQLEESIARLDACFVILRGEASPAVELIPVGDVSEDPAVYGWDWLQS